jgi:hypothetical protein
MERTEPSGPHRRSNRTTRQPPWVWRIIRARPRLFISSAVGIAAIGALTALTAWKPQVADVGIKTKEIRRTVAAHCVVSFFFNVALLALTVNIAASLM